MSVQHDALPRPQTVSLPANSKRTVMLSHSAYERLLAAEELAFRVRDYIPYRQIRTVEDVHVDWARRDAVNEALAEWESLVLAAANGGPA